MPNAAPTDGSNPKLVPELDLLISRLMEANRCEVDAKAAQEKLKREHEIVRLAALMYFEKHFPECVFLGIRPDSDGIRYKWGEVLCEVPLRALVSLWNDGATWPHLLAKVP